MRGVVPWTHLAMGLLLLVPGFGVAQPAKEIDSAAVDNLVRKTLETWKVPGAALVIVRDDKVVHLKGYGVKEVGKDQAVTPDTVFPLASCTKGFTTAAMAVLVSEGKMHWDDPVRRHLDYFHLSDPLADANVTLRDLVTHRTGLRGHELLWFHAPWPPEEAVRRIGFLPLDRSFRSTFQYQSTMFAAAGLAVGATAKTTWADFVRQRLLEPLGMSATTFTTTAAEKMSDRAQPHRLNAQGKVVVEPWYPLKTPDPAGSINSTARDMGNWLRFQLGGGMFGGKRLVAAECLEETHTPQFALRLEGTTRITNPETNLMSYGMGWLVQDYRGHLLVSHAGFIEGFRAQFTLVPGKKLGFALLYNLQQLRMNLALSNNLVDLLLGLPPKDWNGLLAEVDKKDKEAARVQARQRQALRHPNTKPSRELAAYGGVYENPAYGQAEVVVDGRHLKVRRGNFLWPLEHFHYDTFIAKDERVNDPLITFVLGTDGEVLSMWASDPMGVEFRKNR